MSKMSQHFFDTTQAEPDKHMPDNEPCLPPEIKAELDRIAVLNQAFKNIFGGNAPLPF